MHQISLGNVPLCHKDIQSLLLECFITSLRCIGMIGSSSDRVSDPRMVNTMSFLPELLSNFKQNSHFLDTISISPRNLTLYHEDKYPLLLESFINCLIYTRMGGRASDSISDLLMAVTTLFVQNIHSNVKQIGHC